LYTGTYNDDSEVTTGKAFAVIKQGGEIVNGDHDSVMDLDKNSADQYITAISYTISNSAGGYCSGDASITTASECQNSAAK
jgi:hypothetical protein